MDKDTQREDHEATDDGAEPSKPARAKAAVHHATGRDRRRGQRTRHKRASLQACRQHPCQERASQIKEELSQKKELVELRIKSLEKQENQMRDRSSQLKEEVMKTISKEQ